MEVVEVVEVVEAWWKFGISSESSVSLLEVVEEVDVGFLKYLWDTLWK